MQPTFAELYAMAFAWDPEFEFASVQAILGACDVKPGCVVIDAGAGTGRFLPCLIRRGYQVMAVEPDADMYRVLSSSCSATGGDNPSHKLVHSAFENFDAGQSVDAVLAMTDTLSYVVPEGSLDRFIAHATSTLRAGGVFVVDVGTWAGYVGESRHEQWAMEHEGWTAQARFEATVVRTGSDSSLSRKLETLGFEARKSAVAVERTSQRETYAFSHHDLVDRMSKNGLAFMGALEPGSTELAVGVPTVSKRLIYGFRKTTKPSAGASAT